MPLLILLAGCERVQGRHTREAPRTSAVRADSIDRGPQNHNSRVLLEDAELVRIRFDYFYFDDVDFSKLAAPTKEVYQGLACQTDAFLTRLLEDRLRTPLRLYLGILEWSYDPSADRPLSISFQTEAFYDNSFVFDRRVKAVELIEAIRAASFTDYITNYVWQTYPLLGETADVVRNVNRLSFVAETVFVPLEIINRGVIYDTQTCGASSKVDTAWYLGFFSGSLQSLLPEELPQEADKQALACQIKSFMEQYVTKEIYGADVTINLHNLGYIYNEAAEYQIILRCDMRGYRLHANGDKKFISSQEISNWIKTADLISFILEYVHKTQTEEQFATGENSIWLDVQKVDVQSITRDVSPGQELDAELALTNPAAWTSESCFNSKPTMTPTMFTPIPETSLAPIGGTIAPTKQLQLTESLSPTLVTQNASGASQVVSNDTITAGPLVNVFADEAAENEFLGYCRLALYAADDDENKRLNYSEYIDLLNSVGEKPYEGYPFPALPEVLRFNYDTWTSSASGQIEMELELLHSENASLVAQGIGFEANSDMTAPELQQARRDAICLTTEVALATANIDTNLPQPVRLTIETTFLAVNEIGFSSVEKFWIDEADNLRSAFVAFLADYVLSNIEKEMQSAERNKRQLLRRQKQDPKNSTASFSDLYWILFETTDLFQVKFLPCPLELTSNSSCMSAAAKYDIFVLTHNISDSLNSDAIISAAHNVTTEGIASGDLQKSLELIEPLTIWTIGVMPAAQEKLRLTSSPILPSQTMRPASVAPSSGKDTVIGDDDAFLRGVDGQLFSKNQCGGDLGLAALEFMRTSCDSWAGRHVWTVTALAFLALVLFCLFLPVFIYGGYPCCTKKADKITSGATRCTVSADQTGDQPKRRGRRPRTKRQDSGLSSISSAFSEMMDQRARRNRRARLQRQNSGHSGISSISSDFSGLEGSGRRKPRRGRRRGINHQNSGLSELSDGFYDESVERKEKKRRVGDFVGKSGKAGHENEFGADGSEPWFYPQPDQNRAVNSRIFTQQSCGSFNGSVESVPMTIFCEEVRSHDSSLRAGQSFDSGVSEQVDFQSTDGYVGEATAPPRRSRKPATKKNDYDSSYSGVSGEKSSLY